VGYFLMTSGHSDRGLSMSILRGFVSWSWLLAILGFGSRYLMFKNRFLQYANIAVLPFYILHQTIIITVGFYIADWDMGVATKYTFLFITSFIVIVAIYDLLVKRLGILRFLFGLK
jgi:glucan biosynthesis protein C